ncbi:MAG: hypothetical protein L6405_00410 [Actinomycetia bacterium]|nr:hypothetical protein [Actinomycetes bacterium]
MIKKTFVILLIISFIFIFPACKTTTKVEKETSTEITSIIEEKESGPVEDKGIIVPEIEGLYYDKETNIFSTLADNNYGLDADVKVGVFIKDAFELNGIVESSICLIPEIIKDLQESNLYKTHEFQFPIPFDLVRTNSLIMNVDPIELNYDDPEKKDYYLDKYTHLQIKIPDNTLLYAPIETKITDEWNGCIINNKSFEEYKDSHQNTMRLTLNSTDQLKYKEPDEILGAHITINEINNCISSFAMSPDDIKKYDNPNPSGPPWYKTETKIGTPLLLLNNEYEKNYNSFPLDIKPCLEMFFNVYKVGFDEERQWYKVIKNLETVENVFLEIKNIKVSVIASDNFPSDEEIKNRNSKNNILISETKDTFNGIKINGLDNIWKYNKWVYTDKKDNSIVGYWDENNHKIILSSNILKGKWQDLFVGLPLERVQELQESKGWPPAFPFNPIKYNNFTAKVDTTGFYDKDNNFMNINFIVFNLSEGTEIVAPIEGALRFGGGSFSEEGANTVHIGLNNILGRIEFSYFLKEPMKPIDMDVFQPKSYCEGSVLLTIDNTNATNDFSIVWANEIGNFAMVMREACDEFDCPQISIDFNSFLKDEKGRIVYIDNQANEITKENPNITSKNNETVLSNKDTTGIAFPIKIKTLVLNYDPILKSHGNKFLHELCGWNNPRDLAQGYINDINKCSGGKVIYEIIDWIDINDIIPYTDGFQYTPETFYEHFQKASSERWDWWGWNGWHAYEKNQATGMADYRWIINTNSLTTRLNNGEIDEVLIFAQPFSGMYESLMIGPNPIWCNSNPLVVPELKKNFIIMSFNYERGVDCMLENFGQE